MNRTFKKSTAIVVAITFLIVSMFSFLSAEPVSAATQKLNKSKVTLYVGETTNLKMVGTSAKPTFTTSNKSVATISKTGKVTAKKTGKATITAKVKGKSYKCVVTVKSSILIDKSEIDLSVNTGGYIQVLSPYGYYWDCDYTEDAGEILNVEAETGWTNLKHNWSVNRLHISGLKEGTAKIRLFSEKKKETKYITVNVTKEGSGAIFSEPGKTWFIDDSELDEKGNVQIEIGCYPAPFTINTEVISGEDVAEIESSDEEFNLVFHFNVHKKKNGTFSVKVFDVDNPDSYEIVNVVFY